ncbi:MAG: AraC family transcriptional regulator [Ponticaulis sp.]|nr:AraC family transcriptional regulator [Ponticaulis sp.]
MVFAPLLTLGLVFGFHFAFRHFSWPARLKWIWYGFMISLASFVASAAWRDAPVLVQMPLEVMGVVTCGMSWLLARHLFQSDADRVVWPLIIVAALAITGLIILLARASGASTENGAARLLMNANGLVSSTVLLLVLVDVLSGLGRGVSDNERSFRLAFASGYSVLLVVAVFWLRQSAAGSLAANMSDTVKIICAMVALIGGGAAVWYRQHYPLQKRKRNVAPAREDIALGERIRALLSQDDILTQSDLRVRDVANILNEPEHRVSSAITTGLGYANFNRLMNDLRIIRARADLRDPNKAKLPVLTIAMDCGFGSIGPFNRAFKDATGQTPTQYRRNGLATVLIQQIGPLDEADGAHNAHD